MSFELPAWYRAAGLASRKILQAAGSRRIGPWNPAPAPTVWIHAASLGESKGIETLVGALPRGTATTITCTTASGVERLASRGFACELLPCDDARTLAGFLQARRVRKALFLEAEAWPGALHALLERGAPAAFAAFRGSPRSLSRWRRFSRAFPGWTESVSIVWTSSDREVGQVRALGFRDARPGTPLKWSGPPPPPGDGEGPDAAVSLHVRDLPTLHLLVGSRRGRGWLWFPRHPATAPLFRLEARRLGLVQTSSSRPAPGEVRVSTRLGEVRTLLPGCRSAWISPGHDLEEPFRSGVADVTTGRPPHPVDSPSSGSGILLEEIASWLAAP